MYFLNSFGRVAPGASRTMTLLLPCALPLDRLVISSSSLYALAKEFGRPSLAFGLFSW
jgi:hypothetical protein